MDPYRDANAPPPYDGPMAPYCPPAGLSEKQQPAENPGFSQPPPLPQQGYPPQGYPTPGYPPQGYPTPGYPPQGYSQQPYAPIPQGPPLPQGHPQTVIVTQPAPQTIVRAMVLGRDPMRTDCPSCHEHVKTRVDRSCTMRTHLFAVLLCLFGCWPCACIPYCMDSCRDSTHSCPKCKTTIGTYRS